MTGAVVHSILEASPEAVAQRLNETPGRCAFVEIRADRLRASDIAGLVRRAPRPVIVAARTAADGGSFDGSMEEKRELLRTALDAGAAFVDLEWNGPLRSEAEGPWSSRAILSHHGGACTAQALRALYDAMSGTRSARLKIVPAATRTREAVAVRQLLARAEKPLACFATGDAGSATRVLALAWGSWGTYGAAARGAETASGQWTSGDLLDTYRVLDLTSSTRRFGLAGTPVAASPSPALHAAGYREAGLDAVYVPLETDDIDDLAVAAGADGFDLEGFGVTVPLKEAVAERCETLDEFAACGAVNTVVAGIGWKGFNTDAPAALGLIQPHVRLRGARVAVAGAGGTARAIAAALVREGAVVTLFNRSATRAAEAGRATGAATAELGSLVSAVWDVLVQATPLGRRGEGVLPARALTGRMVLDAAYGPETTPLVADARRRGLAVADGYDLLAAQAALQFERLAGRSVPAALFSAAISPWRPGSGA